MNSALQRVFAFLALWAKTRVKALALKAPKEAPDLLVLVLALAVVLIALYIGVTISHV